MQFFSVLCVIRLKHMTGIGQLQTPHILRSFCHSMNPTGSDHLSPIIPAQNINLTPLRWHHSLCGHAVHSPTNQNLVHLCHPN